MTTSRVPTGTYRLQLHGGFAFDDAAAVVGYLGDLGVSHLYCSPVLAAAPGSTHGYDVVDHSSLSDALGGAEGFDTLVEAAREAGLGLVLDVVPNHMAVQPAQLNAAWWSLLAQGRRSPYANWFDVDWTAHGGRVLVPVLGARIGEVLEAGELVVDENGPEPVLRYHDHVLPLAAGTRELPLPELLDAQHYRLAFWRVGGEELNYRRFFDVTELAGVRVECPAVFDATHEVLLDRVRRGQVHGLRVDHPDGLADPDAYLRRLAEAAPGSWVVVEKILQGDETLPAAWPCAGTTGYEALRVFSGVLVDADGERPLTDLYLSLTGAPAEFSAVVEHAKRQVLHDVLGAEVDRLAALLVRVCGSEPRLRDHTRRGLTEALVELLVAFDVYRAYVVPGAEPDERAVAVVERATSLAVRRLPRRSAEIALVRDLVLGRHGWDGDRAEVAVRFAQTCGAVMAKGVEDTAFYRDSRFVALNEVGGDPAAFGVPVSVLHAGNASRQREWPDAMTTLSTHDTKRGEDVRARLAVLSEIPLEWSEALTRWRSAAARLRQTGRSHRPEPATEYLFWQTLVGAWPVTVDRLTAYMRKATREAKRHTSWTDPDPAYDESVRHFVTAVLHETALMRSVGEFVTSITPYAASNVLAQKLLQLAAPGVPDVYQGSECVSLTLVDPDNRRAVDFVRRRALLDGLADGRIPDPVDELDAAKMLVTSRVLRVRREHPEWFGRQGTYEPLHAAGAAAGHLVAFARSGHLVAAAPRLTARLEHDGGWRDTHLPLPAGRWTDVFSGATCEGVVRPAELFHQLPVALLVRD